MNGARADPWVNTTSVPHTRLNRMAGSSQNFLRTRKNSQTSAKKDIWRYRAARIAFPSTPHRVRVELERSSSSWTRDRASNEVRPFPMHAEPDRLEAR